LDIVQALIKSSPKEKNTWQSNDNLVFSLFTTKTNKKKFEKLKIMVHISFKGWK